MGFLKKEKKREEKIKLTDSINKKLEEMKPYNDRDVYLPKKKITMEEEFVESIGREAFFGEEPKKTNDKEKETKKTPLTDFIFISLAIIGLSVFIFILYRLQL